ncbi:MAG: CARDB domain-containing protein [Chloroflexus sp.]|uniref:CARDB domain-containing protein n=1 Tax=Chloroflexus sp. TaxID=1904827 RepID=UPI003D152954
MRYLYRKLLTVIAIVLIASSGISGSAYAQSSAYNTNFITAITYQNISSTTANLTFTFYPSSGGTPISFNRTLNGNAGASLNVGTTTELSSFSGQGSAVISSDQPIVATVVQLPQSTTVRNRPLSNGFTNGSNNVLIATVLKNTFNQTTKFSIQNADTAPISVTLRFFSVGSSTPTYTETFSLNQGVARFFDAGTIAALGPNFNGSATIEATGKVVATAIEASTDSSYRVSAFEGVSQGSNTVYMPSALCNFGGSLQQTAYAVQNTSTTNNASVTVTYKNLSNTTVATQTATIPPNSKQSFLACNASGMPSNFNGSAVITSTGGSIVAIGKVIASPMVAPAFGTAFVGASGGAQKLAAPYVRWTQTRYDINPGNRQRAYLAIQNVGTGPSGTITVKYYDLNGVLVGTHTLSSLDPGQKTNSKPIDAMPAPGQTLDEFGYVGGFGGSAMIECANSGCQIVALVRIQSANSSTSTADQVAEDYNAIPVN